jgi:hypothetical protein
MLLFFASVMICIGGIQRASKDIYKTGFETRSTVEAAQPKGL